jgi:hypothetical protein
MVDERLLAPIRRFWTEEEITAAYQKIFAAYGARLDSVTVIVGKSSESESAQAQVVIAGTDYLQWMDALESRLIELENTAAGITGELSATTHTDFSRRPLST